MSLILVAAIGVGAFVYAASDGGTRKAAATVTKADKPADPPVGQSKSDDHPTTSQVASESPVPKPSVDDNVFREDNEQPELDGYEARRVFIGLSPSVGVPGRRIQIELRGFVPFSTVNVTPSPIPGTGATSNGLVGGSVTVDKHGRGKLLVTAPLSAGLYNFVATGPGPRSTAAVLKVVIKK